jgi:hypothetical protein
MARHIWFLVAGYNIPFAQALQTKLGGRKKWQNVPTLRNWPGNTASINVICSVTGCD